MTPHPSPEGKALPEHWLPIGLLGTNGSFQRAARDYAEEYAQAAIAALKEHSEGEREVLAVYEKLHSGKIGAHWLWALIEQVAAGVPEDVAFSYFGYYAPAAQLEAAAIDAARGKEPT